MPEDASENLPADKINVSFNSPLHDTSKNVVHNYINHSLSQERNEYLEAEYIFHQPEHLQTLLDQGKINPGRISDFLKRYDIKVSPQDIIENLRVNDKRENYYALRNQTPEQGRAPLGSYNSLTKHTRFHTDFNTNFDGVIIHELVHSIGSKNMYYTASVNDQNNIEVVQVENDFGLQSGIETSINEISTLGVFFSEGIAYWVQEQYLKENDLANINAFGEGQRAFSSSIDSLMNVYRKMNTGPQGAKIQATIENAKLNPTDPNALARLILKAEEDPAKYEQDLRTVINTTFSSIDPDIYDTLLLIGREYVGEKPLADRRIFQFATTLKKLCSNLIKYESSSRLPIGEQFFKQRLRNKMENQLKQLRGY